MLDQLEAAPELIVHRFRTVPDNIETAALCRTGWAKGCDDDMSAKVQRTHREFDVFFSVFRVGQEIKDGPVMPNFVMIFGQDSLC
jgi:hypothetical protein